MNFFIYTYGCKVNQYESEKIRINLLNNGHKEAVLPADADYIIVNSCVVTDKVEKKNKRLLRKLKREFSDKKIVLAGCLAGKKDSNAVFDISIDNSKKIEQVLSLFHINETIPITKFNSHSRAFIKVQDGCNQFCSYCIIPYVRGRERSIDPDSVLKEASTLVNHGYKEIVLTGIHTGRYEFGLANLISKLSKIDGLKRIRVSSIEVVEITDELIYEMQKNEKFVNHFHIPLQSGSTEILSAMNRPYTKDDYLEKIKVIREHIPNIGITTDVIVGFPGETEKDFMETVDVIKSANIHRIHAFPFSKREGTPAFSMDNQIDDEIKQKRMRMLRDVASDTFESFAKERVGKDEIVLIEDVKDGYALGYAENYLRVKIYGEKFKKNGIINVRIEDYDKEENLVIGRGL